ncbi:MAG: DUF924 family protein [Elainellaceae cyanobacterium]
MSTADVSADILAFWFGDASRDDVSYQARRKLWFRKSATFDKEVRQRFESVYRQAVAESWARSPDRQAAPADSLALTLLLDQLPRNMFRGSPAAFAADPQAQGVAKQAIARGFDQALLPLQRMFFYFPLEHSECGVDQQQAVDLFKTIAEQAPELSDAFDYARRHQRVIDRFGRFPHRNPILGRRSTPAEVTFLKQPGARF